MKIETNQNFNITGVKNKINTDFRKKEPEDKRLKQEDSFTRSNQDELPQWTVLVYSSATGDIDKPALQSVKEIADSGSSEEVNVAIQLSRNPFNPQDGWKGSRRYYVQKQNAGVDSRPRQSAFDYAQDDSSNTKNKPSITNLQQMEDLGQIDMSNHKNLENFIKWGMNRFPAKRTMLVLGGHSAGFMGAVTDDKKAKMIHLPQVKEAIDAASQITGKKPGVLVFNSCFMGQGEVISEMGDSADFLVASEKPEYKEGMPLGKFLENLKEKIEEGREVSPGEAASILVKASDKTPERVPTISAVDLKKTKLLEKSIDELADNLIKTDTSREILMDIIKESEKTFISQNREPVFSDFVDLCDFSQRIMESAKIRDKELKQSAGRLVKNLDRVITGKSIAEFKNLPPDEQKILESKGINEENYQSRLHGVSIFLPYKPLMEEMGEEMRQMIMNRYGSLSFAKNTRWLEFLKHLKIL